MTTAKEFIEEEVHNEPDTVSAYAYIDNVWCRMISYPKKGDKNTPHKHTRDHATLLASGSVNCVVNGESTIFTAPKMILIHKDHEHQFEALEDNTLMFCIHGIREDDGTGTIVSADMIPEGVPPLDISRYFESFVPTKEVK